MAENTIDTLELQIQSNANQAEKSLNSLVTTLGKVNKTLHGVNSGGIGAVASNVNKLSAALNSLSGLDISLPKGFAKEINGLSKIDFSAFKDMDNVSKHLRELASGIQAFDGLQDVKIPKLESKNIRSISRAINSFEDVDVTKIQPVTDGITKISHAMSVLNTVDLKDSKITNVLGSIKRLTQADMSNFDVGKITEIANSISSFSNIPEISSNVNRFVSSFARLANAGEKTGKSASGIADLGKQVRKTIINLSVVGEISDSLNLFVQSVGRLASSGGKAGETARGLESLAIETRSFFDVMKDAPKVSENTIRMTEALAQLASAGGKVGSSTNTINRAVFGISKSSGIAKASFNVLVRSAKFAANQIVKLSGKISSAFKSIVSSSHGLNRASLNLVTLLKTAIGFRLGYGLLNFGKSAIKLGSDITEAQNVVDVAFGSMSGMVDKFAESATENFGLSEIAAKQYSGTMMAMLKSSGVMKESAAEMSTTLAGLAGDIASFYNIDTESAFAKIRSGIAGEIEPLRQLGISMTVANLEAYALSQGITKSYQAMTQAEQVMLRYNYLMWASADAQGDFSRTSGNYANQIRLLTMNFQQLSSVLGQGLIAAILPGIQALNALMGKLIQVAETFRNFVYTLMGKKLEGSQGGIVNDLAGIGDTSYGLENLGTAGGDAASGMEDATGAAHDLKKALSVLSFDELNQLSESASAAGGALGGIGGGGGLDNIQTPTFGGLSDALDDAINSGENFVSLFAHRIRKAIKSENWQALGIVLANELNKGLQKVYDVISWKNVGPKITAFTTAFTETFNSLVTHFNWDLLGRTVGTGVNTIVNTLNQLADGIDWINLGSKMAEGFNGLFDEVDWNNLGHLIGNKFRIAWDMFAGFVKNLDYADIGRSIAEFLTSAFGTVSFGNVGTALSNLMNGAFESLRTFTKEFEWNDFANNVSEGISNFLKNTEWKENGAALGDFLLHLADALRSAITNDTFYDLGKGIGEFLGALPWADLLKGAAEFIIGGLSSAFDGLSESGTTGAIVSFIGKAFIAVKVADITGIGSLAGKIISHFVKKFESPEIIKKLSNALGKTLSSGADAASTAIDAAETAAGTAAKGGFKSLLSAIGSSGAGIGLIAAIPIATEALAKFVEKLMGGNGKLSDMGSTINDLAGRLQNLNTISNSQADEIRKMIDSYEDSGKSAQEMVDGIIAKFSEWGLSTEEINMVLQNNEFYMSKTADSINLLTQGVEQLGTGFSQTAEQIDLSGISASEAWAAMRSSLDGLSVSGSEFDQQYRGVLQSLDMSGISSENAQDALDSVVMALEAAGIPTNDFIQMMKEKFPEAFTTVKQSAETNMGSTQKAVSDNMRSAEENAKQSAKAIANSANENFSKVDSEASKAFGNVSESSKTDWTSSYDSVNESLNKMKSASSEKMRQIFKNVESYTKSIWNITSNNWDSIGQKIFNVLEDMNQKTSSEMSAIVSEFSNLGNRITNSVGDMYSVGQNAAQSFANGFQSVHIPVPQLYISSWDTHQLGKGKYFQTPNFSLNWYKKGGLFNNASVIGVGEAGTEAVLPLENRRTMSMIADSILSNSKSTGISEEVLTNAVARGVAMAMMNNQQNPINVTCYAELKTEDNEVLARAVTKGQKSIDRRLHPTLQFGY